MIRMVVRWLLSLLVDVTAGRWVALTVTAAVLVLAVRQTLLVGRVWVRRC